MIITKTPFRISFFGGGTDYPSWFRKNGGGVISAAIDKYCFLTARYLPPFFDHKYRVVYSKVETTNSISEIVHPSVRAILNYLNVSAPIEIHHDGDLPARSGIGSSSAFTVGLLNAIHALKGEMLSTEDLARESIYLEQEVMKETVGSQDQISAAYGGFNYISFHRDGSFSLKPMVLAQERLDDFQNHLMLFFTGINRYASDVASTYVGTIHEKEKELNGLTELLKEGFKTLAGPAPLGEFGKLLDECWKIKKSVSSNISTPHVDEIYKEAMAAGALGGKLIGAGGGGFVLFFVPPAKQQSVRERLRRLVHVPIRFDFSGSQVIFYTRDHNVPWNEPQKSS